MRKLLVAAVVAAFALGMAGTGCDESKCFPVTCPDDRELRLCDPPSCETESCDLGYTCHTAQSGEQICVEDTICL